MKKFFVGIMATVLLASSLQAETSGWSKARSYIENNGKKVVVVAGSIAGACLLAYCATSQKDGMKDFRKECLECVKSGSKSGLRVGAQMVVQSLVGRLFGVKYQPLVVVHDRH
jgi:hypothetical protein